MKKGLKAFKFGNRQYYFKNEKIEFIYNMIFLLLGSAIFYFYSLLFYAIVKGI